MRILIADDNPKCRECYARAIREISPDIKIDEVDNGDSLLERVAKHDYQLIITDQTMPGSVSGSFAVSKIREFDPDTPIWLYSQASDVKRAIENGANRVYSKDRKSFDQFKKDLGDFLKGRAA